VTNSVEVNDASAPNEGIQTQTFEGLDDQELSETSQEAGSGPSEPVLQDLSTAVSEAEAPVDTRSAPDSLTIARSEVEEVASVSDDETERAGVVPDAVVAPVAVEGQEAAPGTKGESARKVVKSRFSLKIIGIVALVLTLAGAGVFWFYVRPTRDKINSSTTPTESLSPAQASAVQPAIPAKEEAPPADPSYVWEAKRREVETLHQRLTAKKEELRRLRQSYHYGVLELEEEVVYLIKSSKVDSLPRALKNRRLELALQSIQRRQAYQSSLDKPLRWLESGCEEMLYLKRLAHIDDQMRNVFASTDTEEISRAMDAALWKFEPTAERLLPENARSLYPSLETIWKRVSEQAKTARLLPEDGRNDEMVTEICDWNIMNLNQLTHLTLKAARCLAESRTVTLFMNQVSRMTPAAAQKLAEWQGEYLGLNGLTELPAEIAKPLFNWPGQHLSLNRLSDLPVETAAHLAGWPGHQLELMGLQKAGGIEFLIQWESKGGRLYVPDAIRKQLEESSPH
jgi:hypothetical protein